MGCASSTYQIVVVDGKGDNRHTMPPWQGVSVGKAGFKKDGFTISSGLGKGKFGAVFCGTTKDTKKVFALKFIAKNIIYETSAVDRVQQVLPLLLILHVCCILLHVLHVYSMFHARACISTEHTCNIQSVSDSLSNTHHMTHVHTTHMYMYTCPIGDRGVAPTGSPLHRDLFRGLRDGWSAGACDGLLRRGRAVSACTAAATIAVTAIPLSLLPPLPSLPSLPC